jgi:acyl-CoA thioesterase
MTTMQQAYRFDADTAVTPLGGGRWSARLDTGWSSIGGAPNGGYTLAVALAAAAQALPGTEPLSTSAHYLKPVAPGPVEIEVEVVKRGRMTSAVCARLTQDGTERMRVLASYGDRAGFDRPTGFAPGPPPIPGPDGCLAPPVVTGTGATIVERFEYRVTPQTRWVTGAASGTARIEGWIRFADGREPDVAALPLFVDAFPPSVYEVVDAVMVPTLDLSVHLRQRPAPGWLQARFTSRALVGGTVEEDGELWDATGRLVAMSRQLALVLPWG